MPARTPLRALATLLVATLLGCAEGSGDSSIPDDAAAKSDALDVTSGDLGPADAPNVSDTGGCSSNESCRGDPAGSACDLASGRCVQCAQPSDCAGMNTHCDIATHTCVGCTGDSDCGPGTICRKGACALGCNDAHPCGVGAACCGGSCVNLQSDALHCGACETACAAPAATCCLGTCADTATSAAHCGACGSACTSAHGMAVCAAGTCGVGACDPGFGDCDHTGANGCESDLATDSMNCGGCGRACTAVAGATARCMMGVCNVQCDATRGDCDGAMDNGCESVLASDPANCGMCGRRCPVGPNATATCASALCGITCAAGYGDCDNDPSTGCEVNLNTATTSCGACGVICAARNATATCALGHCGIGACSAGYADCDGDATNGCETPTSSDSANCGMCGRRCATGTACVMGACTSVCSGATTFCDGTCAQIDRDVNNCGVCGRRCAAVPNGTAVCTAGACAGTCNPGFADCNGSPSDGCEVNLTTDLSNCGACGATCSRANATSACMSGACRIAMCFPGFSNCNGADADGCEGNLLADPSNCGGCARVCAVAHATSRCASGLCAVGSCFAGYSNCNGSDGDGCEAALNTDNLNCGGCGRVCPAGTACSVGTCASICSGGTTFCSGACVDTATNLAHCGTCGHACAAGQLCRAGACVTPAAPNDSCSAAQPISMAASSIDIAATTVGAANDMNGACGSPGAPDVFFSFTVPGPAPELVYAHTFGAGWDTVLYFASSCGSPLTTSTTPNDAVCNDDAGSTGCTTGGLQSNVVALFNPGTYYLVLDGYGSSSGAATVHFEHLPVGNGPLALLGAGATSPAGTTAGTGRVSSLCGGGSAPENTYWWRTCPESPAGAFSATLCSRATWDTLIYLLNGNPAGNTCNDDSTCGLQSTIASTVAAGAGIHAFYVDGYFTYSGAYTVAITRP